MKPALAARLLMTPSGVLCSRRWLSRVTALVPSILFGPWPVWAAPVSFRTQVMAVLSRAGCNSGPCHGSQNGKNGFKLSLRGQDPALDFTALTRDMLGRRLDRLHPGDS